MELAGKTVVVTGASSGIGRQVAKTLARAGAAVGVLARRTQELDSVCAEISGDGGTARPYPADVRDSAALEQCLQRVHAELGELDIVVHCAGMTIKGPLQEMPSTDWDTVLDTNLKSAYQLARLSFPYLRRKDGQGNAKFVAIGSVGTYLGIPLSAAYCASKGGLVQLVKALAVEWAAQGINVNAVCPGYVLTPLSESVLKIGETYQKVVSRIPMRRIGSPEDIANAVRFLVSPYSDYITGTTLNVDGGLLSAAYTMDD